MNIMRYGINEMSLGRSYKNVPFVEVDSDLLSEYMDFCCNSLNKKNVIVAVSYSDDEIRRYHVNNRYIPDFIVGQGLHLSVVNSIVRLKKYIEGSLAKDADKICVNGVFDFESFKWFFENHDSKLYKLIESANNYCRSLYNVIKKLYNDIEQFNLDNGFDDSDTINLSRYDYRDLCGFVDGEIVETGERYSKTRIENLDLIEFCRKISHLITNMFYKNRNATFGVLYYSDYALYPSFSYKVTEFLVRDDQDIDSDVVRDWIKSQRNYAFIDDRDCLEVWNDDDFSCRFDFYESKLDGSKFFVHLIM